MNSLLIKNARIVNEGAVFEGSVLIREGMILKVYHDPDPDMDGDVEFLDAGRNYLFPGIIDDQVHFREPGLTRKGDIYSESRAAVAGGVTSFMEMPNTNPQTISIADLEDKHSLAAEKSLANYSFYLGATNDNLAEIKKLETGQSCGVKVFMGASTGNMLVDNPQSLEAIFAESRVPVTTHCEDENLIRHNINIYKAKFGENMPLKYHPKIRSEEACYRSSSLAVKLASKHSTRLHVLHLSTARELSLFDSGTDVTKKMITAEVCVHHLCFDDSDYEDKGNLIKWNPAIKAREDREGLLKGLLENKIDVIATDHAPHTRQEKSRGYFDAPSGGPLVQHSLVAMLEFYHREQLELPFIIHKMSHAPALLFNIKKRGFIREGYFADLVLVEMNNPWNVSRDNILYKCGWSPFEGETFSSRILRTYVNGNNVYQWDPLKDSHIFHDKQPGMRLEFERI